MAKPRSRGLAFLPPGAGAAGADGWACGRGAGATEGGAGRAAVAGPGRGALGAGAPGGLGGAIGAAVAGACAAGADAGGAGAAAGRLGSLMVALGLGGKLIRTVSFFG